METNTLDIPPEFNELARLDISFRTIPSPDRKLVKSSEAEVRRYTCIWGLADNPQEFHRIPRGQNDPGVSPSLQFIESLEIDSGIYLIWKLAVAESFTINDKTTSYHEDYLVLARMDDTASYCTGFYLNHPLLREVQSLRPEHFAWLDHKRHLAREAILEIYHKRITDHPGQSSGYYDLALIVWTSWSISQPNYAYVTTQILPGPLEEAMESLTRAVELAPRNARYRGLLGEVQMALLRYEEALQSYRQARALDNENPRWAFLIADALLATGDESAWRRELGKAKKLARAKGGRTDERNARLQYQESLERSAEKLRSKVEHLVYPTFQELAEQDRTAISIHPDKVPADLRDLIPLAEKWGIGDDSSRSYFVDRVGHKESAELARTLEDRWERIQAWLDSFPEGGMSDEAGYFMYMLEAAAEME